MANLQNPEVEAASIECHIGGSIRPSRGGKGGHFALLNPLFWRSLTSGSFPPSSSPFPSSLSLSSSSTTQDATACPPQSTSCLPAICLGLGGDPRGRPLRANPSTRPSRQPARRAWVAAPASGHGGRLCGGVEAGEVLLASSRRPGGSWCELRAPIISR